jgi:acyl dehydratase
MEVMGARYLEDFTVGSTNKTGSIVVDKARMMAFAAEFDPQPFHLDEAAAKASIFGGLSASGWYTAALTMRMVVDSGFMVSGSAVGLGWEEFRWPRAVYAGDELHVESEVIEVRPSQSKPDRGVVRIRQTTLNQRGEPVQTGVVAILVPRRPAA